jgi:hypothetical protein
MIVLPRPPTTTIPLPDSVLHRLLPRFVSAMNTRRGVAERKLARLFASARPRIASRLLSSP